jgi:uncharacterized protein
VKYLLDANVWLQAMGQLEYAADVLRLLAEAPHGLLATTDFTLHSIGVRVARERPDQYRDFLDDLLTRKVNTLHLPPSSLYNVLSTMQSYGLDFDDAIQYVSAERNELRIVSFDSDFDRTPRGRLTPAKALVELQGS